MCATLHFGEDRELMFDLDAALDWIRKAANLGYWDAPWMRKDAALANLHRLPEFAELTGEVEARQRGFRAFVEKEAPAGLDLVTG